MAKIKFIKDCVIECCTGFDNDEEPIMEEEEIKCGEEFEDVLLEKANSDEIIGIQFGDGSYSFVQKVIFDVLRYDEDDEI